VATRVRFLPLREATAARESACDATELQLLAFARMPPTEEIDDGASAAVVASRRAGPFYRQLWFLLPAAMVIGVALGHFYRDAGMRMERSATPGGGCLEMPALAVLLTSNVAIRTRSGGEKRSVRPLRVED
jgi:hypothetical protein